MMNILARILSHGFAIAVVVILAVGYIYRGELFPGMELPAFLYPGTPATTEAEAPAGDVDRDEPAAEIAPAEVAGEPAAGKQAEDTPIQQPQESLEQGPADAGTAVPAAGSEPDAAAPGEPPEEIAGEEPEAMAVPVEPPAEPAGEEPLATVDTSEPEVPAVTPVDSMQQEPPVPTADIPGEPVTAVDATAPATPAATADVATPVTPAESAPAEDSQPAESAQETAGYAATPAPPADIDETTTPAVDGATDRPYQLLAMAREAFWMHDYAEAETKYRDLIALEPDNPDGYGELGNMYFTRGDWEQAADAYFKAGKLLVQAGRTEQAEVLVEVIRGLNGKQADELEALLKAASDTDRSQ
jgi:hypothetical protein